VILFKKYSFLLFFLIFFQNHISNFAGGNLGLFFSILDEFFFLFVIIFFILASKRFQRIYVYFSLFFLVGLLGFITSNDVLFSFFISLIGLLFVFNFPAIFIFFRNFNIFQSNKIIIFFNVLTLLIGISIILQLTSEDVYFSVRDFLGLRIEDNKVVFFTPFPTIFYGLWESAYFNFFATLFYFLKIIYDSNNKYSKLGFIIHFTATLLSGRLVESVILLLTIFYYLNFKKKLSIIVLFILSFIFVTSKIDTEQINTLLNDGYYEKFTGYTDLSDNLPVRTALFNNAIEQSFWSFPLGIGIGGFSSRAAQLFLDNTIFNHSFYEHSYIARYNSNLLGDNGYATILGEFGILGSFIYFIILFTIYKKIFLFNITNLRVEIKLNFIFSRITLFYFLFSMLKGNYHFYTFYLILFLIPVTFSYNYASSNKSILKL
jgi:hypothetical protein